MRSFIITRVVTLLCCRSIIHLPLGQVQPATHPHLMHTGEVTPLISLAVYKQRRAAFFTQLPPRSVVVLFGKDNAVRANDIPHPFRQTSDFLYLTGCTEPSAISLFTKVDSGETFFELFLSEKAAKFETWNGPTTGTACGKIFFGCNECHELHTSNVRTILRRALERVSCSTEMSITPTETHSTCCSSAAQFPNVFVAFPPFLAIDSVLRQAKGMNEEEKRDEQDRFRHLAQIVIDTIERFSILKKTCVNGVAKNVLLCAALPQFQSPVVHPFVSQKQCLGVTAHNSVRQHNLAPTEIEQTVFSPIKSPIPFIRRQRFTKCAHEVQCLLQSANATKYAFEAAMRNTSPGVSELVIESWLEHAAKLHGATGLAYPPVVAGGVNALSVHYVQNRHLLKQGDLVCVDAGAEWFGYPTDCSRTWPVSGRFTEGQKELYNLVLTVQTELLEFIDVGGSPTELQEFACQKLRAGLEQLGILSPEGSGKPNSAPELTTMLFPHRVTHYIGLDIHEPMIGDIGSKFLPGAALTIEPSLRIPCPSAQAKHKYFCETVLGRKYDDPYQGKLVIEAIPPMFHGQCVLIEDNAVVLPKELGQRSRFLQDCKANHFSCVCEEIGNVLVTTSRIPKTIEALKCEMRNST